MFSILRTLTVISLLPFTLGSCYSYRQIKQSSIIPNQGSDQGVALLAVYALNAGELPYEHRILKKSGLYRFTSDSLCNQKIQLLPLEKYPVAALARTEALPVIVMTLGQVPLRFQEKYAFHYYMVSDSLPVKKEYELIIDRRVWFWDIFSFKKSRRNTLARNLYAIAKN